MIVGDESGRADHSGTEPGAGAVDRPLGLAPPLRALVEGQLAVPAGDRDQPLDPDADEP